MKVKNIMFSGFMAVILMGVAGNASAAVEIASRAYVDQEVGDVSELVGTLPEGTSAKTIVEYVNKQTEGIATEGAMTALAGRVTTAEGEIDALQSAVADLPEGKTVADAIAGAVDTAKGELTTAINAKADATTVNAIDGRVTTLENAGYQNASQVSGAITTAITGLKLADTYEAKGEAAKVQANVDTLSGTVDGISEKVTANEGAISTLQGAVATKAAASDVTALGERVTTAEGKISTAEGEIDTLQSDMTAAQGDITTLQGDVAKKVDQTAYDTKVGELNTAIAGNTAKIGENTAKIGQVEATANAAIPMPEGACATGANCVLSTVGGTIQWVNITEPLD